MFERAVVDRRMEIMSECVVSGLRWRRGGLQLLERDLSIDLLGAMECRLRNVLERVKGDLGNLLDLVSAKWYSVVGG